MRLWWPIRVLLALSAAAHLVPALGLTILMPAALAMPLAVLFAAMSVVRLRFVLGDRPRPRWRVRLLDEPIFWLWGGALVSLLLFVPAAPIAALLSLFYPEIFPAAAGELVAKVALLCYAAGLLVTGWGVFIERRRLIVRHVRVPIVGLAPELEGYRIAQLSDLHIGSFDNLHKGLRWAERANRLAPDLAVVTGDLVTSGVAFYEDAAAVIAALRAPDGVLVIMGNHDQWDNERFVRVLNERGLVVLRNEWRLIERGDAKLVVAGLDDQYTGKDDLLTTLSGRPPGLPTLLLSHYPDFFERAARLGVSLVLSGHTHGGQIGIPFFARRANIASLSGQRGRGLFRDGSSYLYVNAGLGTTGPPMRLGIPPEIALIELGSALSPPEAASAAADLGGKPARSAGVGGQLQGKRYL